MCIRDRVSTQSTGNRNIAMNRLHRITAHLAPAQAAGAEYTMDEVSKHNTSKDCWVVVGDMVLNVTEFLPDHPGGKKAIMLYAGKDATEEFDMLHKREVIDKYAPEAKIGTLKK
eukprot:TRINITY_DN7521_c0_g1_i2.p1 TRINITY_DN7521_c0_g1~~TRINITY_DN7521_c0_g1_i2.p1  ORF type:complete len:114 (+),score=53.34 TRINITY_DN7521_c0_g1_i2:153-494(+)